MLFNKNEYTKAGDQKVLHKVGKNWVVLSTALLLALAGAGAVSANTTASADTTNNANTNTTEMARTSSGVNPTLQTSATSSAASSKATSGQNNGISSSTASKVASLESDPLVNEPSSAANNQSTQSSAQSSQASSSASSQAPSLGKVNYLNGNNGSAASEHARDEYDQATMNYYGPTVKSYINSVNAKFPTQTKSLHATYASAKAKQASDASLASSFATMSSSAIKNHTVSSLASNANTTTSAYTDSVAYNVSANSYRVSSASNLASEGSKVDSYAHVINAINNNSLVSNEYHESYKIASMNRSYANAEFLTAGANINTLKANSVADSVAFASATDALSAGRRADQVALANSSTDAETVQSYAKRNGFNNSTATSSAVSSAANEFDPNMTDGVFELPNANGTKAVYNYDRNTASYQLLSDTSAMNSFGAKEASYSAVAKSAEAGMSADASNVSEAKTIYSSAEAGLKSADSAYNEMAILGNHPTMRNIFGADYTTRDTQFNNVIKSNAGRNYVQNTEADRGEVTSLVSDAQKHPNNRATDMKKAKLLIANVNASRKTASNDIDLTNVSAKGNMAENGIKPSDVQDQYKAIVADAKANPSNRANDIAKIRTLISNAKAGTKTLANDPSNVQDQYNAIVADAKNNPSNRANDINKIKTLISNAEAQRNNANGNNANDLQDQYNAIVNDAQKNPTNKASDLKKAENLFNGYRANNEKSAQASDDTAVNTNDFYSQRHVINGLMSPATADASDFESVTDNGTTNPASMGSIANTVNSMASNEESGYKSASMESATYASSADVDIVLASSYAKSYANDSSADSTAVSSAENRLNGFYAGRATSSEASDYSAYTSASNAEPNDSALAEAFALNVYNHAPKFITVTKNAGLYDGTIYAKSKHLATVPAGTQLTVNGIGFDDVGTVRYTVNYNGTIGHITAHPDYVTNTFLEPNANYTVTFKKGALAHSTVNFGQDNDRVVKNVAKGTTLTGKAVHADKYQRGVIRLQLSDGSFVTANKAFVDVKSVSENTNVNNNDQGHTNTQLVTFSD